MRDRQALREDTPGCAFVAHFNNAGAALMPRPVLAAQARHLEREAQIGGYEAAAAADGALEAVYGSIARLLGASPDEIAVVESATRAWDMAFYSLRFAPGDEILTCQAEYASNYIALLQVARRAGAVVRAVPDDEDGAISLSALERAITPRTRLIALTHAPTSGGLLNPAAAVGALAHAAGVPYLLDACQSVGQYPLDVEAIGCDFLSGTGRKYLRGPRGTGFLYVRRSRIEAMEPVLLDLHAATWVSPDEYVVREDARRFEQWEANFAGKLGLGAAVDYANALGMGWIREQVEERARRLREALGEVRGVTVRDRGRELSGIVTFTVDGVDAEVVKARLGERRINVSVSGRSSTLLDLSARGISSLVRASVHYYNTDEEIEGLCGALV